MKTICFFQRLSGSWIISRFISNHGCVRGDATFRQIETNVLHYHEQGLLTLESSKRTLACYRDYVYRYEYESDAIFVYFVEAGKADRLFHMLRFPLSDEPSVARATHHCKSDTYEAIYELINADNFKITYKVSGPNKNYESHTFFQRKPFLAV